MNIIFLIGNIALLLISVILFFVIKKKRNEVAIQSGDSSNLPLDTDIIDVIFSEIKISGNFRIYGGLVGKIVKREGKEYLVLSCDVIPDIGSIKYRLRLYSPDTKKVRFILLSDRRDADFLKKYGVLNQLPIRSRVIRRDVKNFCNNMCIQDCSDCVLKKYYGKTKNTSK